MTSSKGLTVREVQERHRRAVKRARNSEINAILKIITMKTKPYYNQYSCGVIGQGTIENVKKLIRARRLEII